MAYPGRQQYTYPGSQDNGNYGPPPPFAYGGPPPGPPPGQYGPPGGFQGGYGPGPYIEGYNQFQGPPGGYGGPSPGPYGPGPGYNNCPNYDRYEQDFGNSNTNVPDIGGYGTSSLNMQNDYRGNGGLMRPPTEAQQFGNGAPSDYSFQYSNCQGRRKALLIGINYFGQRNELRGCINDVRNVSRFLNENYGYKYEDMVILTDDQTKPRSIPTKANMIGAMQWLVKDARPNDSLFFHYSGHGGQTRDLDGDEEDGYDEVIYPVDYQVAGHLVDDDMHAIMVTPLMPGVRLTAIFDSCHSGTALDLPYLYSTQGVLKEPNLAKEAGMGVLTALSSYSRGDLSGAISSITGVFKNATGGGSRASDLTKRTKTSPADVILFSGCKDSQTSADSVEGGQATGAMSYAFIAVLNQNPNQSFLTLLQNMRQLMAAKYSQKPQLSCSHPLDTNLQFIM
ncbi:caspase domain-containing protein [Lipomyces arxii]|uniref:caspase domain-containing protein n=1 Tax=Lipomyces arxii TaxID=56418 RepID=UPI0034CF4E09